MTQVGDRLENAIVGPAKRFAPLIVLAGVFFAAAVATTAG
jgi:hypothetical protein